MILGVLYIIVMIALLGWPSSLWMFSRLRGFRLSTLREIMIAGSFAVAVVLSLVTWLVAMRSGIRALEDLDRK